MGAPPSRSLAECLAQGALDELDLTPKPGLVDRRDSGSHGDLTYEGMRTSAELLPLYYADILRCCREGSPLESFVHAGLEAEARMFGAIRSNAHKGYIFLSGLALMAACDGDGPVPDLRTGISEIARRFFAHFEPLDSHGAEIRHNLALGGIRQEAEAGLPAVFEHGWPAYRKALEAGWELDRAGHYLMAILMQRVEDTTAIRRCGLEGLDRLRRDGALVQALLERGEDAIPALSDLNEEYIRMGLTMGGVADCIALVFALEHAAR
jgi:triphosphoribosyl-dephospho-CoA synthase